MAGLELIISSICNATFCSAIYDNPFLDAQLSRKQKETLHLVNDLNGKHLKIGTYNNYPLSWVRTTTNGTLLGQGVAFLLVNILQKKFNFTYEVVVPAKNFEFGGARPEDSIVGLANASKVDMVAAFLPKLEMFQKWVWFSHDLDIGLWMMMLKRPKESAAGSGLLAPFNNFVWYVILASVLSFGPCITLLTRLRSKLMRDNEKTLPLSPSFWFVYSAFIKQGTSLAPEANTTRVLFATWWLFIILLSAFYTANLTAFLTLSKFTLDIENAVDLYKKNYKWVSSEGGSVQQIIKTPNEDLYYLNKMVINGRAQFRSLPTDLDFLNIVNTGAVLVKEQTGIDHLMYNDYLKKARDGVEEDERCTYVVAPNAFMRKQRAFAYPVGSHLKNLFDPVLAYIVQAGIIDFLKHRDLPTTKICPLDLQSKDRQLRNSDLLMTYYIMLVGLTAAITVFIGELLLKRQFCIKMKKDDRTKPRKTKSNKSTTSGIYDDSLPPPYESLFAKQNYKNKESQTKVVNGREYYVCDNGQGGIRLIPVRAPSAFLYR